MVRRLISKKDLAIVLACAGAVYSDVGDGLKAANAQPNLMDKVAVYMGHAQRHAVPHIAMVYGLYKWKPWR